MKTKIKCLMFAVSVTLLFGRCGKDDPPANGKVVFWMNASPVTNGNVAVAIGGVDGWITTRYVSGVSCTTSGCAIYDLKPGTYTYEAIAQSPSTAYWSGSVTITSGGCLKRQLN